MSSDFVHTACLKRWTSSRLHGCIPFPFLFLLNPIFQRLFSRSLSSSACFWRVWSLAGGTQTGLGELLRLPKFSKFPCWVLPMVRRLQKRMKKPQQPSIILYHIVSYCDIAWSQFHGSIKGSQSVARAKHRRLLGFIGQHWRFLTQRRRKKQLASSQPKKGAHDVKSFWVFLICCSRHWLWG